MALTSKQDTFAICIVFPALALIMITLRFWIRKRRNAPWKADDYLCIPAWVSRPMPRYQLYSVLTKVDLLRGILHPSSWCVLL